VAVTNSGYRMSLGTMGESKGTELEEKEAEAIRDGVSYGGGGKEEELEATSQQAALVSMCLQQFKITSSIFLVLY
jgi:hypothetical protein